MSAVVRKGVPVRVVIIIELFMIMRGGGEGGLIMSAWS